jgi:hypothetical protein
LTHRFSATRLAARALAGTLLTAGLFLLTPAPRAQGTLIAPGGQPRVTAPGGLRGRAALRHRHKARRGTIHQRRHR